MIIDDKYYEDDDTGDDSPQPKPDLYEHHRIVVDKGQGLIRIDKYLTNLLGGVSRTRFQNAADFGFITVNGDTVKSSYRVKPLDEIVISLETPPSDYTIVPQDIPLSVVFEDDDIMVVNKTPDMVVHPGVGNLDGTLLNTIAWYLKDLIEGIIDAVSIPVMAKARIGHFVEAQVLESLGVDYIDESEVLTPADYTHHIDKWNFTVPFVCGATNLGEALRRINEGAAMIRSKGEAGTGDVSNATRR